MTVLADTSAWVEYDKASGSAVDLRMTELMSHERTLAVTEPVVMELLARARSDAREQQLRRLLVRFEHLPFHAATDFDAASRIYRRCRRSGITPRGIVDCMIAAVAWRTGAVLLAFDADVGRVAQVIDIQLDESSLRP